MIALPDRHAGIVHEESVQATRYPRRNGGQARLVEVDPAHHADRGRHESTFDRHHLDIHELGRTRADAELGETVGTPIIDQGNQRHLALRTGSRFRESNLGMHGTGPPGRRIFLP